MSAHVRPPHPAIDAGVLAELYAHAHRDYPSECCGIVYGPKGETRADRAQPCRNIQNDLHAADPALHTRDARTAYNLGAGDLLKLGKSLRGDQPAKIIYHSHVDIDGDGCYFSATDQAAALMDGEPSYPVEYVVIDVRADGVRGAAQFCWDPAARAYLEIGRYPGI